MAARVDFRQRLTNALIESIEENDGLPWEKGWANMATRPFNPVTGIRYKGGNVINLLLEQIERGSDDPRWMTLKQANDAGYRVRKGAMAAYVQYWDWGQPRESRKAEVDEQGMSLHSDEADEAAEEEKEKKRRQPRVFYAAVFNGNDIVGLPEIKREKSWEPNELAEKLIAATGAVIEHTAVSRVGHRVMENAAYYHTKEDKIVVPPRESFKSDGDYYATVLHELAHWTGHHTRLARRMPDEKRPHGSQEYAQEELRAEIASMYLTSMLGVDGRIQNHAKYTASWLKELQRDKHEIFRAARDAEMIVDHIFEYAPELREVVESRVADNVLPKNPQKREIDSGIIKDLPNFIPPEAKAQVRTGRDDPRWAAFAQTVRSEARKSGVGEAVVENMLGMVETKFTEMMDTAKKNGYTDGDMNTMLVRSIVDEMRTACVRQQQWERFCDQVRRVGAISYPAEQIEQALQELGCRYQQLIAKSTQEGWTNEQTDTEIRAMIFGEEGRRPITLDYVKAFIERSPAVQQVASSADSDDDFVLTPLGLSDAMPEDLGSVSDERINSAERYIMDDAEIHGINTP